MENYTEFLKEYLKGRRNINKKLYVKGCRFYRAVQKGRTSWDYILNTIKR